MSSNYIGELFPCQIQTILQETVFYKHILTYLTFLFLIVFTQYDIDEIEYNKKTGFGIDIYDIQYKGLFNQNGVYKVDLLIDSLLVYYQEIKKREQELPRQFSY